MFGMGNAKMAFEHEESGYRFEKYPNSGTVNIYFEGVEVDVFTHYEIGADFDLFEESCMEYVEEALNESY